MIRAIYRTLVSFLCRHEWKVMTCRLHKDFEGYPMPLEYWFCRKCGIRKHLRGWDD